MSMNYIGRVLNNFKEFYNEINGATLTGAIDVVVVEQPDGTFNCSPFHVRFGKIGVLRSREKVVDIEINGESQDIHMKLGESGEAFFVEEVLDSDNEDIPEHLATSPIPVSHFEELYNSQGRRRNSFDLGDKKPTQRIIDIDNLENQTNDYTKRRYTTDNDNEKKRERDFIKRQIGLGNLEWAEASMEDLTLSLQSNTKGSAEDLTQKDEVSDTIFKMDSLDGDKTQPPTPSKETVEESTVEVKLEIPAPVTPAPPPKIDEPVSESKSGKKKRRKRSVMKKKNSQRKVSNVEQPILDTPDSPVEVKGTESNTDRSSMESSPSETDLKDTSKAEENTVSVSSTTSRKVPMDPDFHFFSDTELTTNQVDSRPNTPIHVESVQSDTEFEVQKSKEDGKGPTTNPSQSWAWGEFPKNMSQQMSPTTENQGEVDPSQDQQSMLSHVFSFMKQNKHRRRNSNTDGVYLADISSGAIDPEIASLYFTTNNYKRNTDADMDCESGNGPSLTQSPNSAEGSKSIDSDFDETNKLAQSYMNDVSISLCGWDPEPTEDAFIRNIVAFSDLCNNPTLFHSDNLVVRIKKKYYTWKVAAPIISSLIIYQRPLPQSTVEQLVNIHMPVTANAIGNNVITTTSEKEQKQEQQQRSYWWSWRRGRNSRETTPVTETAEVKIPEEELKMQRQAAMDVKSEAIDATPNPAVDSSKDSGCDEKGLSESPVSNKSGGMGEKCRKTLRLSSNQIAKLNLRPGMNEVEFSVTTAYQGTSRCKCHIYRWKWDDKIVISDIDGTITKSDVLGHILPIVGADWAQTGVAQLFNKIKDNGYKLLYLSARAIGQARTTREYLKSIKQGDLYMPDGPVLLNPTSLISAFHREVIEKKPEQFKISCMSDIKALFPLESDPFYAGYGNRINDVWAYTAVGIPIVRIFTINPKGELKHELTQTFQSSYANMSVIVDQLFPHVRDAANDYSSFMFWREPMPIVDDLPPL